MEQSDGSGGRIRILATGWRLASAQVAFVLAGVTLLLALVLALFVPFSAAAAPTLAWVALAVVGFFAVLGAVLFAACRYLVVDADTRRLTYPGGHERSLDDVRAIVATGQAGRASTGSGRKYAYVVWSVGALTESAGTEILSAVGAHAEGLPDETGIGLGLLVEAVADGYVLLVDAATEKRAARIGARVAGALGVPYVTLPPDLSGLDAADPSSPPPAEMGHHGSWG